MQTPRALRAKDVHLWTVPLEVTPEQLLPLHGVLDREEQRRAARFRFDRDRIAFVVGRAALRQILAVYLNDSPNGIAFAYGPHGKPAVAGSDLHFNVSHSGALAVIGVARHRIGVDIERLRDLDYRALSERFFATCEIAALDQLAGAELQRAFFRCWTRKEAYVKARGDGLFGALRQFAVSVEHGTSALLWSQLGAEEVNRWAVIAQPEQTGYEVATVVENHIDAVVDLRWKPVA